MRKIKISVTPKISRLDLFLAREIKNLSRSRIKKLINEGNISVNKELVDPNYKPVRGDEIEIEIPAPKSTEVKPENIPLKIVFEDSDVLVIDKEPGMVTHPTLDHPSSTVVNALLFHLKNKLSVKEDLRPGIVHRLDKDTSGLLVIAKTEKSLTSLKKQFKDRGVTKKYVCLVQGKMKKSLGKIEGAIDRHKVNRRKFTVANSGREAITKYKLIKNINDKYSLLEVEPKTGRTHQIRVHLAHIGHPVVNDKLYGGKMIGKRQFLHATYLAFTHPKTGKTVIFKSSLPTDLQKILDKISRLSLS